MIFCAELDEDDIVLRVMSLNEADITASVEESFKSVYGGGTWVPVTYNSMYRNLYCLPGFIFSRDHGHFIPGQPFPSWTYNHKTELWEAPIPYPKTDVIQIWNEADKKWVDA